MVLGAKVIHRSPAGIQGINILGCRVGRAAFSNPCAPEDAPFPKNTVPSGRSTPSTMTRASGIVVYVQVAFSCSGVIIPQVLSVGAEMSLNAEPPHTMIVDVQLFEETRGRSTDPPDSG